MEPGIDDKTAVDWQLIAMGIALALAIVVVLVNLL